MSAPTADALAESLRPLTEDPARAAVFCDIDGTLAPIVSRAEDARVRHDIAVLLGGLARRYRCVACVSGRSAAEARRLVGVGRIFYAGSHGAELLGPGETKPRVAPEFAQWQGRVREFAATRETTELRLLRVRVEDKGPIVALHWRDVPDEDAALARLESIARDAEDTGFATHWGRKVLEIRPPVAIGKDRAVNGLVARTRPRAALFGGDDTTDLDAFDALEALVADGELASAVLVGVRSDEGPRAIVERAGVVVDGVDGFVAVLSALAGAPDDR